MFFDIRLVDINSNGNDLNQEFQKVDMGSSPQLWSDQEPPCVPTLDAHAAQSMFARVANVYPRWFSKNNIIHAHSSVSPREELPTQFKFSYCIL
jgi:hypothetical protein